jgi:hypothetical protein
MLPSDELLVASARVAGASGVAAWYYPLTGFYV